MPSCREVVVAVPLTRLRSKSIYMMLYVPVAVGPAKIGLGQL